MRGNQAKAGSDVQLCGCGKPDTGRPSHPPLRADGVDHLNHERPQQQLRRDGRTPRFGVHRIENVVHAGQRLIDNLPRHTPAKGQN